MLTRHLQNTCPGDKKDSRRKKKIGKQHKGWKFPPPDPEEEEIEVEEPIPNENNQTDKEVEIQETSPQGPMETQPENMPDTMENSGTKRLHTSDTSDSDKENP